ncbi:MAG: lipoyl(octanoyl) transferase LipB [Thermoanaerobaculia bacterium]
MELRRLGRIEYGRALELQAEAAERCRVTGRETLFLLEHDPVFTLGRNADPGEILFTPQRRSQLGIALYETDRGGKATYHGPGQLVGYPILDLSPDRRDVKRYVRDLEEAIILTLAEFGIVGERSPLKERVTSVWVGNDKIAAIGVHISRWITTHGFALNVTTNLDHFLGIIPCGITDGGVTSIQRVSGRAVEVAEAGGIFEKHFSRVFGRSLEEAGSPVRAPSGGPS